MEEPWNLIEYLVSARLSHPEPSPTASSIARFGADYRFCCWPLSSPCSGSALLRPRTAPWTQLRPGAGVKKIPIIRDKINFPDGSYMIYGYFTTVNGSSRASIAIINANGTVNAFSAPVTGEVRHVEPLANGQFLIGGSFSAGTYPNNYYNLARLNSNGTLDTGFTQCFDYYGAVNSLAVQSDGKILVGGYSMAPYSTSGTTFHLLRLSSTGSLDTLYSNRSAAGGYVSSVKLLTSDFSRIFGTLPRAGGQHVDYVLVLNSTGGVRKAIRG